jgi:hypothetical protein
MTTRDFRPPGLQREPRRLGCVIGVGRKEISRAALPDPASDGARRSDGPVVETLLNPKIGASLHP